MRRIVTLLSLSIIFALAYNASAQMSKQEEKEWKKRIKKLEPDEYKTLIEENKSLKSQVSSLKSELAGVDDRVSDKDDQIAQYQSQISDLKAQLTEAQAAAASAPASSQGNIDEAKGVIFKVQIGAFTNKDLSKYLDNAKNFSQEEGDNMKKFTLGIFRDYWEADTFKKYLREMGVKDAWIVSYQDGQRVPIKQVLEGVTKS